MSEAKQSAKKPVLPSRTPSAVLNRLPPDLAQRLHALSSRLAGGGNAKALTPDEMKEFESLSGGASWLDYNSYGSGWYSNLNPWNYSAISGASNRYLLTNVYARYASLKTRAEQFLSQLQLPELQNAQTPSIAQQLINFLRELDTTVSAMRVWYATRPNQTTVDISTLQRLEGFERQFSELDLKFRQFLEEAKKFKVQPTAFPQQAVQTLLNSPQPFYQPPPPYQFQPPPPSYQPPPYQYQPPYQPPYQPGYQGFQQPQQQQQQLRQQQELAYQQQKFAYEQQQLQRDAALAQQLAYQQQLQQQQMQRDAILAQQLAQQDVQRNQAAINQQAGLLGPSSSSPFGPVEPPTFSPSAPTALPSFSSINGQTVFADYNPLTDPFAASASQMFAP